MSNGDSLAHYGVRGMKWGTRTKKPRSTDHLATKTIKKKTAKELSDAELKHAINRMKLEKNYKELNPKGVFAGQKAVLTVLALGTTVNAAIAFSNSPAGAAVKRGITSALKRS